MHDNLKIENMKYLIYFILLLGIFQTISNLIHLSKGSKSLIGESAKRQHQELPLDLDNIHFYYKAWIMFLFGLIFLSSGLITYFSQNTIILLIALILFGLYGIIQIIIYKRPVKVWISGVLHTMPIIVYLVIVNT